MMLRAKKLFAEAASRQAAKIGVIASPFLAAARPNSNKGDPSKKSMKQSLTLCKRQTLVIL
jgi:hypothetical protein